MEEINNTQKLENIIGLNNLKTINVFSSEQDLLKIKSLAFDYCTGNNEAKAELEKFLV